MKDLELILKGWVFVSVDARGRSGGLFPGWRSQKFLLLNAWDMPSCLCVVMHSIELQLDLTFINMYGPYLARESFWNNLWGMDCFTSPYLVFGGDLNFSLGMSEIWEDNS